MNMPGKLKIHLAFIGFKEIPFFHQNLKEHLEVVFKAIVEASLQEEKLLEGSYSTRRKQYNSSRILLNLKLNLAEIPASRILGITSVDLYAEGLNFVFGEAQFLGKFALISTHRLKPEYYGETNGELFISRVRKEAVHEFGHTFGLGHCPNPTCVMHFSNSIWDTDRKTDKPCPACSYKLNLALKKLG
jgi:archaemetzincin